MILSLLAAAYMIVGTGQTKCYDDHREIDPPKSSSHR
jgi:hypothetical protein